MTIFTFLQLPNETLVLTYYNAPNADLLTQHYTQLPQKLQQQDINPSLPWLYGYILDFRFK